MNAAPWLFVRLGCPRRAPDALSRQNRDGRNSFPKRNTSKSERSDIKWQAEKNIDIQHFDDLQKKIDMMVFGFSYWGKTSRRASRSLSGSVNMSRDYRTSVTCKGAFVRQRDSHLCFPLLKEKKLLFGSLELQIRGAVHRLADKNRHEARFSVNLHRNPTWVHQFGNKNQHGARFSGKFAPNPTCGSPLGTKNPT